ncbi:penicillin-binding protein 2 [Paludibacterium purpuratum]|uniref:Peptidoglycan D,D-transpeptidase MrdA n=1 Tax=Paludibacterium purpuratum TaxID=1144873 RepID=A0A4R7B0Z3_9NEIS|nr:penicillin-binding protein 2 [Paludibacterium purpuratum]TDR76549.1 penicillin-binding protein 2 [Paludibacterium purpuratum]
MAREKLTSLKNLRSEENQFQLRLVVAYAFMLLMFVLLVGRFIWLQVVQYQHFTTLAQNNRISLVPILPNRGLILDRNGVVLAQNYSSYTLELTPSKIDNMDATIEQLKQLVDITPRDMKRFRKFQEDAKDFETLPLKVKLTDEEAARLAANMWRFPGVEVKARLFRDYPFKELTSHALGYIGRINPKEKQQLEDDDKTTNYRGTTYIGKTGIEAVYEDQLHGQVGFEEVETDSGGRAIRSLKRTPPVNGNTLKLALDIRLQEIADQLFGDRRGALVAIDPNDGGVLAFLSKPGFDPTLFIDGIDSQTWTSLNTDWHKPLVNRALRGIYPPGSTFKPFMAMAALESGIIKMDDIRAAPGLFVLPGSSHQFRDADKKGHGMVNLQKAITVSSDTFFYKLAWDMGIDRIAPVVGQFGLGSKTGIDLDGELTGVLPSKAWKARRFAKLGPAAQKWLPGDVVSIGIGQGYNSYTPLQMANATATMANDGKLFTPHLVESIVDVKTGRESRVNTSPTHQLPFPQTYFDYIKQGMAGVLKPGGTAGAIGAGLTYTMAGKTGTAQVVAIKQGAKYNAASLAEQNRDHSWFIAFAPVDHPKIAIAVIVENGGWGAGAAAPIARQLFDFYLTGRVPPAIADSLKTATLPIVQAPAPAKKAASDEVANP